MVPSEEVVLHPGVALLQNVVRSIWIVTEGVASHLEGSKFTGSLWWVSEDVVVSKVVTENEGSNGGELNENVNSWTRGILKWITDGITDNGGDVLFSELDISVHPLGDFIKSNSVELVFVLVLNFIAILVEITGPLEGKEFVVFNSHFRKIDTFFLGFDSEFSLSDFNFFLGVIPSTTGVRLGESNLDTGNDVTSEDTSSGVWAENETSNDWGTDNESTWGNHLLKGSFSGDLNATIIVWFIDSSRFFLLSFTFLEILDDEVHHVVSGITDGFHGKSSEEVWVTSTDEETGELNWLKDINGSITDSGNESTEKSETDEAGGTNGETFSDSGGSVTSGIKGVSEISDFSWESRHFSNTTSVI
jgi:hypothetical protein